MDILIPATLDEALLLKDDKRAYLAGGTEVLRLGSAETGLDLIDVTKLLSSEISEEGSFVHMGARSTFQNIMDSPVVPDWLKEACSFMASPELRNQATVGGNISSARDDSFLIPALVAGGAEVVLAKEGGTEQTDILSYLYSGEDRLILSVIIPRDGHVRVKREALTARSHAVVTAAFGVQDCWAIKGTGIVTDLTRCGFVSDQWGSAEYKEYLAAEMREEA